MRIDSITETSCKSTLLDSIWAFSWITKNPFRSHHAAALTNYGEATQGYAVLAFCEIHSLRAIPTKLTIEFHAKAKGNLSAECKLPADFVKYKAVDKPLIAVSSIYNSSGLKVCTVTGQWKINSAGDRKKIQ
jgi:hypothetical protein